MKQIINSILLVMLTIGFLGCEITIEDPKKATKSTSTSASSEDEMLINGSFDKDIATEKTDDNFYFYLNAGGAGEHEVKDGVLSIKSTNTSAEPYGVQLLQAPINIENMGLYTLKFKAKAEKPREITLKIGGGAGRAYAAYKMEDIKIGTEMKTYQVDFKMKAETDPNARFEMWFTKDTAKVWLDDISLVKTGVGEPDGMKTIYPGTNAIKNGNFITGESKWTVNVDDTVKGEMVFENAVAKAKIQDEGSDKRSVSLKQGTFGLEKNKTYTISFDAKSTVPRQIELILENEEDGTQHLAGMLPLTDEMQTYGATFKMENESDGDVQLVIGMGNMGEKVGQEHEIYIDNIRLEKEIGDLVWSDEFNYEGLPDPEKWNYEVGGKLFNNEYQYYTDGDLDNAYVKDGRLTIEAIKEDYKNCEYTSARIKSNGKGDLLYGRVEVRAKVPNGSGTWPAIWMMPTDSVYGPWPASGEIDIMEHVGNDPDAVHASLHTANRNFMKGNNATEEIEVENIDQDYHVYSLEWTPEGIDIYYDNNLYFTMENTGKGWEDYPFNQPFYVILNLAVGGDWGAAEGFNPDTWPQKMEVDYVRMYDMNIDSTQDNEAPTEVGKITAKPSGYMIPLEWEPAQDNFSVKKYELFMDGEKLLETKKSETIIKDVEEETTYSFKIRAFDYAGNKSDFVSKEVTTTKLTPKKLPGKIKASEYDLMRGVQTEGTQDEDGGENVGWIDNNDWMEYLVDVPEAGEYRFEFRVASLPGGGIIELRDDAGKKYTEIDVPLTEGWQNWETIETNDVYLERGVQPIRVYAKSGGFNVNWIKVK